MNCIKDRQMRSFYRAMLYLYRFFFLIIFKIKQNKVFRNISDLKFQITIKCYCILYCRRVLFLRQKRWYIRFQLIPKIAAFIYWILCDVHREKNFTYQFLFLNMRSFLKFRKYFKRYGNLYNKLLKTNICIKDWDLLKK